MMPFWLEKSGVTALILWVASAIYLFVHLAKIRKQKLKIFDAYTTIAIIIFVLSTILLFMNWNYEALGLGVNACL
jgi:heme/copper-type cytochrome/quinol oxidase subunit 4